MSGGVKTNQNFRDRGQCRVIKETPEKLNTQIKQPLKKVASAYVVIKHFSSKLSGISQAPLKYFQRRYKYTTLNLCCSPFFVIKQLSSTLYTKMQFK
jgi:hypothetical protein